MGTVVKHLTPLELIRAIDELTDEEKENLALLADEKIAEEILKRRKDVLKEMKNGTLINEEDLFE
ncbi:MAG: hypothetical protein V3R54_04620 [Thermodesulfovibrionia bacterium]